MHEFNLRKKKKENQAKTVRTEEWKLVVINNREKKAI